MSRGVSDTLHMRWPDPTRLFKWNVKARLFSPVSCWLSLYTGTNLMGVVQDSSHSAGVVVDNRKVGMRNTETDLP